MLDKNKRVIDMEKDIIKLEYSKWIDDDIYNYYMNYNNEEISLIDFVEKYGYLITFNFDIKNIIKNNNVTSFSYDEIAIILDGHTRHFYNSICSKVYGRKFILNRKILPLPKAIICKDVNNSKYWSSMGRISNMHCHSIWLTDHQYAEKFGKIILQNNIVDIISNDEARDINVKKITSYDMTATQPSQIASYLSKFIPFNTFDLKFSSDIQILPDFKIKGAD